MDEQKSYVEERWRIDIQNEDSDSSNDKLDIVLDMSDDTYIIKESSGRHRGILSCLTKKRMCFLILYLLSLPTLHIYCRMTQEDFEGIKPTSIKGPQREPVKNPDHQADQQQKQNLKHTKAVKRVKRETNPTLFTGDFDDFPQKVVVSIPGTVTTLNYISYMWRPRSSQSICYKTCKEETRIHCVNYFYDVDSRMCFMIGNHPKRETNPILFTGGFDDFPRKVVDSIPGTVTTVNYISYMWRPRASRSICYKTCEEETRIHCVNYFFDVDSQMCFMIGRHPKISFLRVTETDRSDQKKLLSAAERAELKKALLEKVNMVHNSMQSLSGDVKRIGTFQNQMANTLTNVDKKVLNMDNELTSLNLANEHMTRQLSQDQMANPEFRKRITDLRTLLVDLMSRIEVNPTMKNLVKNQQNLAKLVQSVDSKIADFSKRQLQLDEHGDDWIGRLNAQEQHHKMMTDVLQTISQAIKDVRKDVADIQNPLSAENVQRSEHIRKMLADTDVKKDLNSQMEQDVYHLQTDLTKLIKELVELQLANEDTKGNIMALVEANKNVKTEYIHERINQNKMMTQIKVLSTVYRSILAALHSLELKQIQIMRRLSEYENEMQHIASELMDQKNLNRDFDLKTQLKHDIPILLAMRKVQIDLFKEVYNLRRELFKIQRTVAAQKFLTSQGTFDDAEDNLTDKWLKIRTGEMK
ncbi:uncharacterized protein LOC121370786 isoform X2 [Gigantopelta aegis]|uniref:uncharacterized protein LOC121370786 isoform X2 n=1 Tax=Gigantopelta aegis TaxID=1735272 RepID=UPI001B888DDE|nr:uncharacterized protein LOC121370786 isoform X2 [Gigantopelta aegis]